MLRWTNEIPEMDLPKKIARIDFFNKKDITEFNVIIKPSDESYWYRGEYLFRFKISSGYPHDPPKIMCYTKVRCLFCCLNWKGFSPEYQYKWQCLSKHPQGRLEASVHNQQRHSRPNLPLHCTLLPH